MAKKQSTTLVPQSLVGQAYEIIKEKIINLHFLPGQYLNEAQVCAQLGLSRTPVHQALQRLSLEGLVDVLPRKGIIVQPDTVSAILDILDSRATVEPELARRAAERVRDGELSKDDTTALIRLATSTDPSVVPPDINTFTINDRAFHREFAVLSGNKPMADFAQMLHERSTRFWYLSMWQTIDVGESNKQHAKIAESILSGDPASAMTATFAHIDALRTRLQRLKEVVPDRPLLQRTPIITQT